MSAIAHALPLPPLYYNGATKNYHRTDARGRWMALNETSAVKFIRQSGHTGRNEHGIGADDECLLRIQSEQNVDYVGPLAGYRAGPHQIRGKLVLVTDSPVIIQPQPGQWPTLRLVLEGMFGNQLPYVYGWLKLSYQAVAEGKWSPAQVLALAGPVNSGKSLFQRLVTVLLGGRAAKPYRYLTDRTQFNADLFAAEHLMVEDEAESIDIRARRHFGAGLKDVAANLDHQWHGKHREALVLTPIWRMTVSLNEEPERLQVLPPLDGDVADKVMLLKVAHTAMPMPTETPEEKERFWNVLMSELPAFVDFLLTWEIPQDLRSPRFGIKHYHHPELLEALNRTAPEHRLLALVDNIYFRANGMQPIPAAWSGTAEELERLLSHDEAFRRQVQQLLNFNSACGTYLSRLAAKPDSRVTRRILHGQTRWTIVSPVEVVGEGVTPVLTFDDPNEGTSPLQPPRMPAMPSFGVRG
jgi:hypothetical protein